MKLLLAVITGWAVLLNIGCGDSEHSNASRDFISALNAEAGFDVEIVKLNARRPNFIVVRDNAQGGRIDAYDVSDYESGENILDYINEDPSRSFQGLEFAFVDINRELVREPFHDPNDPFGGPVNGISSIGGRYYYETTFEDVYRHPETGLLFSKVQMTSADLTKVQEVVDGLRLRRATDKLVIEFGLNPKRAKKVANLSVQLSKENPSEMTTYSYNQYSKAILGNSFSDIQDAMKAHLNGEKEALNTIYEDAARINQISVSKVKELSDLFIKN